MLRGSDDLTRHLCDKLEVRVGGTTKDNAITLETAECLGACEGAPCVLMNDEHVMDVTNEKADQLITKLRA